MIMTIIINCVIKFRVHRFIYFMINVSLLDVEYTFQSLYLG